MRQVVLDTETTGFLVHEGHRLVEIGAIELIDGQPTGQEYYVRLNPERDIPDEVVAIHHITNDDVKNCPVFSDIAEEFRSFIANSQVIITCKTQGDYTLDIAFINHALAAAGQPEIPSAQWLNVRRWSEAMFGSDGAKLDKICDRYNISRTTRIQNGHGALLDARLLTDALPHLTNDYQAFTKKEA